MQLYFLEADMAQKSLKELEDHVANLRAKLADAEAELKARKEAKLAKAAGLLAKKDPAFAKALADLMGEASQNAPTPLASDAAKPGAPKPPAKP
jgi:hypothetical protein